MCSHPRCPRLTVSRRKCHYANCINHVQLLKACLNMNQRARRKPLERIGTTNGETVKQQEVKSMKPALQPIVLTPQQRANDRCGLLGRALFTIVMLAEISSFWSMFALASSSSSFQASPRSSHHQHQHQNHRPPQQQAPAHSGDGVNGSNSSDPIARTDGHPTSFSQVYDVVNNLNNGSFSLDAEGQSSSSLLLATNETKPKSDGSIIFEDLVNQIFLEMSRDAAAAAGRNKGPEGDELVEAGEPLTGEVITLAATANTSNPAKSSSGSHSRAIAASDRQAKRHQPGQLSSATTTIDGAGPNSGLPFMQLVALEPSSQQQQRQSNELELLYQGPMNQRLANHQDDSSIVAAEEDDDDRHIQYDMIRAPELSAGRPTQTSVDLGNQQQEQEQHQVANNGADNTATSSNSNKLVTGEPDALANNNSSAANKSSSQATGAFAESPADHRLNDSQQPSDNLPQQHQHQQQQSSPNGTLQMVRTGNIQARSMSSNSATQRHSGPLPQHSRPPYATYDPFHHRSESMAAAAAATSMVEPGASNNGVQQQPSLASKPSNVKNVGDSSLPSSLSNLERTPGGSNTTSSSSVQAHVVAATAGTLTNSINRIASHLMIGDASKDDTIQPLKLAVAEPAGSTTIANTMTIAEDRQLQKLASVNQLVELNPIPEPPVATGGDQFEQQEHRASDTSRYYFSKESQAFGGGGGGSGYQLANSKSQRQQQQLAGANRPQSNDRYAATAGEDSLPANELSLFAAYDSRLNQDSRAHLAAEDQGAELLSVTPAVNIKRKVLESLSHQLHSHPGTELANDESASKSAPYSTETGRRPIEDPQLQAQSASGPVAHRASPLLPSSSSSSAPTAAAHHYAASLINVTAPMVLPLSATEAMESALGDQLGKGLLHQVSGFVRTAAATGTSNFAPESELGNKLGGHAHHQQQQQRHHQYFLPAAASQQPPPAAAASDGSSAPPLSHHHQSIYSQPANQLSPDISSSLMSAASAAAATTTTVTGNNSSSSQAAERERMRLDAAANGFTVMAQRRPPSYAAGSSPQQQNATTANLHHQASGFRSPLQTAVGAQQAITSHNGHPYGQLQGASVWQTSTSSLLQQPTNYLSGLESGAAAAADGSGRSPSTATSSSTQSASTVAAASNSSSSSSSNSYGSSTTTGYTRVPPVGTSSSASSGGSTASMATTSTASPTTNGFITGVVTTTNNSNNINNQSTATTAVVSGGDSGASSVPPQPGSGGPNRGRPSLNLTRVEHISAECSNDLIRTIIVFNGTFKGIIYSSGYVRDPSCMYVNGTGKTRYDFSIRLNQCGTLGRQELHPSTGPNEVRRRDQVMWNTLSIQYNPIIEQEWDEHFRVSCEYGSDFWKTVSFSPFNVETNTGSPVVFTVDPPQCQMEILRGHGMVGPRQEAVSGPVTVGDPLTLLIHMKSERAGYDILVKNCIAHNGGHQKMQLIDSNGCVVNERFMSPFRGTYNDNDLKHVTLYSYLKAFRFTGSPVLYLECEIHMCQSSCPPQMCYWRRLSKRSASNESRLLIGADDSDTSGQFQQFDRLERLGDGGGGSNIEANQLEATFMTTTTNADPSDDEDPEGSPTSATTEISPFQRRRQGSSGRRAARKLSELPAPNRHRPAAGTASSTTRAPKASGGAGGQISDKVSLFQALEVRQEREPDAAPYSANSHYPVIGADDEDESAPSSSSLLCYRQAEVLGVLLSSGLVLLIAISVTLGCCWRAASLRAQYRKKLATVATIGVTSASSQVSSCSSANYSAAEPSSPTGDHLHRHSHQHHRSSPSYGQHHQQHGRGQHHQHSSPTSRSHQQTPHYRPTSNASSMEPILAHQSASRHNVGGGLILPRF